MRKCKPVAVPKAAFVFCKYTVAAILWAGFMLRLEWLVVLSFCILALSAIFRIRRAPLVFLYTHTLNRIFKSEDEILDEYAMRFAHTLGAALTLLCIMLLYFVNASAGWIMVFLVAIAKTAGALGYCSALKLYRCATSDNCCRFVRNGND